MRIFVKDVQLEPTIEDLRDRVLRGQTFLVNQAGRDMNRYVPLKYGPLRGSMKPDPGAKQVSWEVYAPSNGYPYGVLQYHTQFSNYTTPNTGPFWDKKAAGIHMQAWIKGTEAAMR